MELTKKEIISHLKAPTKELFELADNIRKQYVKDEVHLRGLIEISNICKNNCLYCGIRAQNSSCKRYRLEKEEIITTAQKAKSLGLQTVVLQGGENDLFDIDSMVYVISQIKKLDMAITLSLGEKTKDEYEAYKKAGADRYLLRIETTNKNLYEKMHPNMDFGNRLKCIETIKSLGYELGTGCLIGLPSQSIESLAEDILFFKEIDADMIGVGPFIASSDTPLKTSPNGSFQLALAVMALSRILLKNINIPATTAMETLHKEGHIIALQSGANVIMPNLTPIEHKKDYSIYPNKSGIKESDERILDDIKNKITSIGRIISSHKGFRAY